MIKAVQYSAFSFVLGICKALGHVTSWHVKSHLRNNSEHPMFLWYDISHYDLMSWCDLIAVLCNLPQSSPSRATFIIITGWSITVIHCFSAHPLRFTRFRPWHEQCFCHMCEKFCSSLFTSPSPCMSVHIRRDWYNRNSWTHHSVKHGPLASCSHRSNGSLGPILGSTLGTTRTLQGIPSFK